MICFEICTTNENMRSGFERVTSNVTILISLDFEMYTLLMCTSMSGFCQMETCLVNKYILVMMHSSIQLHHPNKQ